MPYNYLKNRKILSSSMHCSVQEYAQRFIWTLDAGGGNITRGWE